MSKSRPAGATDDPAILEKAPAGHAAPGEYTHKQIVTILWGLLLGMFLGALDQTIVSTAIRTIADDLHGLSAQAWVTTAYLITSTITTPIYGKLGDLWGRKKLFMFAITVFILGSVMCTFANSMYELAAYLITSTITTPIYGKLGDLWGRKKLFMFAITVFILGSVMCTFANSMYELAAFRAFQGLGAGGLFTLVLAIIGDIVAPRERARYTGYFMATFGTSSVLGPVIGGFFAGTATILGIAGWRWVFLVNVPIGIVALFVVYRTLHVHHTKRRAKIDWMGAVALVICLVPLLTVAEQGRVWGWGSTRSLACVLVGVLGMALFVAAEVHMKHDALIPLKLFTIRPAAITIVASLIVGMGLFGGMMLLPLYMQIVHGASPTESGFMMLPMVAGLMCASIISGRIISRTGKTRIFPLVGSLLMGIGMILLAQITADTPLALVMAFMFITGYGVGNCMQPLILTVQSSVPPTEIGVATSSATFFRQIGGTIGVAIFLSILFSTVEGNIADSFASAQHTPAFQQAAQEALRKPADSPDHRLAVGDQSLLAGLTNDSSVINHLDPRLAHPLKEGFAASMDPVFWTTGALGVLAFLVLLFMPEVELRQTSASAAARAMAEAGEEPVAR